MRILDEYTDLINASFSQWIEVEDNLSRWTIEDFPYSTGVDENITYPHCWKCVTVNHCWFKNEENKKPARFDYSNTSFSQTPLSKRGLYHPHCHCKESAINNPKIEDIEIIMPEGKIDWIYKDKYKLINSWGYNEKDRRILTENIIYSSKIAYHSGNYQILRHTKSGINISLFIEIPGINEKLGHIYKRVSSYMIFPNGKLKNNTPISRRWE